MVAVNPAEHVKLLYLIANKYRRSGQPFEELVQEGAIGLSRAAQKYDPSFGTKFSTYASLWIHSTIRHYLNEHTRLVALPANRERELRKANALPPSPTSFDAPIASCGEDKKVTLHDLFADEGAASPEAYAADREERAIVGREVAKLPARTRLILRLRFLQERTLAEVGEQLNLSRERIRQIEVGALATLRKQLKGALQ